MRTQVCASALQRVGCLFSLISDGSDPTSWYRWHVARKSECTAQCGLGYRTLEIYCAKISHADGKTEKVDDRFCSGQHKPDNKEGCHGDCNPGGWEYSPWSEVGGRQILRMRAVQIVSWVACSHSQMLTLLCCSAPRAAGAALAEEGRRAGKRPRPTAMRASAAKGTS